MKRDYATTRSRPGPGTILGTFFYMWLLVGLVLGTLVLVGPVRVLTKGMGDAGWEQSSQDHVLIVVILVYLAISLVLTRYVVGIMFRSRNRNTRFAIAAVFTILAAGTAWLWKNPATLLAAVAGGGDAGTVSAVGGAEFIFGAYPDEQKLRELRVAGITSVISLQHPGVIVEREGISAEKEATKKLGMRLIQAPMLPWVSDNEQSLQILRNIARRGTGKFYVHCGLGRDRVNVAKRVIEAEGMPKVGITGDLIAATRFEDRSTPFERGSLALIDEGKWMIPYPNEHEMFGFILGGQAGHVVSLLDTTEVVYARWQNMMQNQLKQYQIPFTAMPLKTGDRNRSREIAKAIRAMPGKVTVVAPETPTPEGKEQGRSEVAAGVMRAYGRIAPKSHAAKPSWKLRGVSNHPDSVAVANPQ